MRCAKNTGILLLALVLGPALFVFFSTPAPQDALELHLHLIFVCHGETEVTYQLSFSWSARGAVESGSSLDLQWRSQTAYAVGVTVDPIHQVFEAAFREIHIRNDNLQINQDGGWTLDVPGQVNDYFTVGVRATGWRDTLIDVYPYGEFSLVPWSLKNALAGYGVESVDVKARVALRISADLLTHFVNSVGIVLRFYYDLVKETITYLLDSFSTLT